MENKAAVRRCDLAVVGSGGAGFAAAIAARRAGLRVVMVERGVVGGTCVNTGCVPSKALLAAGGARRQAAEGRFPGVATQRVGHRQGAARFTGAAAAPAAGGRIRGVHVVADGAGELIQAAGYALECGMTTNQLAESWSPFLTMTEGLKLAA